MIALNRHKLQAFSLVELMVALAIGLIILTGLVTVFDTTSKMNKTQNGLARLQENGRYAVINLKQNLEQAGYQYCLGSSINKTATNAAVATLPWVIYTPDIMPGLPNRTDIQPTPPGSPAPYLMDTAYLIHGHECGASSCNPTLTSVGSATTFTIPNVGTASGTRLANTDVLTFRYLQGKGRAVDSITTPNTGTSLVTATIQYTPDAIANNPIIPAVGARVLIASCDNQAGRVVDLVSSGATQATANLGRPIRNSPSDSTRLFDLSKDLATITYYVGVDVVNGRDIPTLYSVKNGVRNAIIQGVDRFDVLYGVKTLTGGILLLTADQVEAMPVTSCTAATNLVGIGNLNNVTGCGWRSVVSIEIHLLLNTIYNSSLSNSEPFYYSLDQTTNTMEKPTDLKTKTLINTYNMFRKEFVTTVTLKNY